MAQEDKNAVANLPIASIVALVLFASGLWVQHQPLQSDRPGVVVKQEKEAEVLQDVEARLWQDPLEAIKRARVDGGAHKHEDTNAGNPHIPKTFQDSIRQGSGTPRLVLPVLVYGGPYAEDAEQRRRTRYAVLSGLREAGYAPDTSRSIGYVRVSKPEIWVAFEKWLPIAPQRKDRWNEVHVLWLAEEGLGHAPVQHLEHVLNALLPVDGALSVTVLGPQSDRMAVDLANRLYGQSGKATSAQGLVTLRLRERSVKFMAPSLSFPNSTLIARLMQTNPDAAVEGAQAVEERIGPQLTQLRVGPDDAQLARLLVGELANRGIHACRDQLALVVEADTHYARSLAREFRKQLRCQADARAFAPIVFHYFRGLDGRVARDEADDRKGSESQRNNSSRETVTPYQERAYGQGQFDYLRRVAAELRRRSDEQRRKTQEDNDLFDEVSSTIDLGAATSRGGVRAVIVLGSDIHDKLAVLHALRESLAQVTFVITDMDAGLLQKEHLPWTRNVLVGTGFDLTTPTPLQNKASPFRDTYQTATFIATRRALVRSDDELVVPAVDSVVRKVRLFEIGSRSPVQLSSLDQDAANLPARPSPRSWPTILLGALALGVFGFALNHWLRRLVVDLWARKTEAVKLAVGVMAAALYFGLLLLCIVQVSGRTGEEPLRWADGMSAWPSALICHVAGLLAIMFFIVGRRRLRKGEQAIEAEFFGQEVKSSHADQKTNPGVSWRGWLSEFQDSWFPPAHEKTAPNRNHALATWLRYRGWSRGGNCALRLGLASAAAGAVVLIMIDALGLPTTPVRGPESTSLYFFMIVPGYLLMIPLMAWTLDRVALCSMFLHRLYGSDDAPLRSGWDAQTQKRFCGCAVLNEGQNAGTGASSEDAEAVESYIDLRLTARLSQQVGSIIVYPFLLALLLIVARARYLDDWGTTPGYLAIQAFILTLLTIAALTLRHNAERIRRHTIERFEALEVRLRACDYEAPTTKEQLALMKQIAINLKEGAFAPLSSQPIVRGILLPFGGAGLINLLDFLLI